MSRGRASARHRAATRAGRARAALVAVGVAFGIVVGAATTAAHEPPLLDPWRWVEFTEEDGLPSDEITGLLDLDERVWVGTTRGAASYDGWRWRAAPGVPAEPIVGLAEGSEGEIWIATESVVFRGGADGFTPVTTELLADRPVRRLVPIPTGVLVDIRDGSSHRLLVLDTGPERWLDLPSPLARTPAGGMVWTTGDDRTWISLKDGFYRIVWEDGTPRSTRVLASERLPHRISTVATTADGRGLFGVHAPGDRIGLWEIDGERVAYVESELRGYAHALDVAPDGTAIVVYESGAVRLRHDGVWQTLDPTPRAFRFAEHLQFRDDGDLWVGGRAGLFLHRSRTERWGTWSAPNPNDLLNRVHEIAVDEEGAVWIVTSAGLAAVPEAGGLELMPLPPGFAEPHLTGLAIDEDGRMWVSSGAAFEGCFVWDGASWSRREHADDGTSLGLLHKVRRGRDGALWLLALAQSTENPDAHRGSVHRVVDDRIERWTPFDDLTPRRVYDVVEAPDGTLWFATSKGVERWRDGTWAHWDSLDGLAADYATRLALRPDGGVWVGHRRWGVGLITERGQAARRRFLPRNDLDVWDLALDDDGRLWVTTFDGLWCLQGDVWSRLDPLSGLGSPRLWPVLPTPDRIFAGSLGGGLYALSTHEFDNPAPRVRVSADVVSAGRARVEWRTDPWWGELSREAVMTRHRIDGGPWSAWSTRRSVVFDGLEPGHHDVDVQAKGLFGSLTSPEPASFMLQLPLHRRLEFIAPVGGLSVALVVLLVMFARRRRRDARALRESELEHRQLMEQASDAIFVCDADAYCLNANQRALDLLGCTVEQLRGRPLSTVLVADTSGASDGSLGAHALSAQSTSLLEMHLYDEKGRHIPVEASIKRRNDGRIQAFVRDLTERRRLESERRALERHMTESQRLESLGVLASGVAHDFNNLLMVMIGGADQALATLPPNAPAVAPLQRIITAAQRAGGLTQQLLSFAGRDALRFETVELNALVAELVELLQPSLREDVELTVDLARDVPPVHGDPSRLRQVTLNLIMNASDAIGEHAGSIHVETYAAASDDLAELAEVRAGESWAVLRVTDSGSGIDATTRARIFEPFFTTKTKGRGLGLAAVQGILRSHRGSIHVGGEPGRGATFTVLLPASSEAVVAEEPGALRGAVVVVDDQPAVREVTAIMLKRLGLTAVTAADAREAVERCADDDVVCVMIDLVLPEVGSATLLDRIRANRPGLPAILISGVAADAGPADDRTRFLQKPFTGAQVRAVLEDLLSPPTTPTGADRPRASTG